MTRSRPVTRSLALLLALGAVGSVNLCSASPLFDSVNVGPDQSPYLHFPHPETRHDGAFSDNASMPSFANLVLPDEDWRQNPVPALNRHPRAKRDLIPGQKHQPGRKHKRELLTEFDPPFPPGACESSAGLVGRGGERGGREDSTERGRLCDQTGARAGGADFWRLVRMGSLRHRHQQPDYDRIGG